jgi:broad specificity phosphatase PhoE
LSLPTLYIIRHGETAWSASGQHTGRSDIPLTEQGERNALCLAPTLSKTTFSAVFTSPSHRARRTAELAGFGAKAMVEPGLAEWDYGKYEGLTTAQILAQNPGWDLFRDGCPCGESVADISARADRVLTHLRRMSGNILLFSSGHISRVIATRWLGLDAAAGRLFSLGTASLSILGNEHASPSMILWNDRSHLG